VLQRQLVHWAFLKDQACHELNAASSSLVLEMSSRMRVLDFGLSLKKQPVRQTGNNAHFSSRFYNKGGILKWFICNLMNTCAFASCSENR
jgi:hypothetical protein